MTEEASRWASKNPGQAFEPVDPSSAPASGEVLVEIDACSLWRRNIGYAFGDRHGGADASELRQRIDGHVVEAGEEAIYLVDRQVALSGAVPCGHHEACWTGAVAECPHKASAAGASKSVIASARDVEVVARREPHLPGPGLAPFKDE